MAIPRRLVPLLSQFDFGREQLVRRLVGLTDEEHLWEPVPNCWSIRPQAGGPGPGATLLVGAGDDTGLGRLARSTYPDGGDPEERFVDVVWWVTQELLHHGAEIALLRDLYRDRRP